MFFVLFVNFVQNVNPHNALIPPCSSQQRSMGENPTIDSIYIQGHRCQLSIFHPLNETSKVKLGCLMTDETNRQNKQSMLQISIDLG